METPQEACHQSSHPSPPPTSECSSPPRRPAGSRQNGPRRLACCSSSPPGFSILGPRTGAQGCGTGPPAAVGPGQQTWRARGLAAPMPPGCSRAAHIALCGRGERTSVCPGSWAGVPHHCSGLRWCCRRGRNVARPALLVTPSSKENKDERKRERDGSFKVWWG